MDAVSRQLSVLRVRLNIVSERQQVQQLNSHLGIIPRYHEHSIYIILHHLLEPNLSPNAQILWVKAGNKMRAGKFLGGILSIQSLVKPVAAMTPNSIKKAAFSNTTRVPSRSSATTPPTPAVSCFPFQNPRCCIDYAVCECLNGWCCP